MDDLHKDQDKKEKTLPSSNAPSFMQPRKPVLDEPLEEGEEASEVMAEVEGVEEEDQVEKGEGVQPEAEAVESEESGEAEAPYSPYFPRGVYEDAQAVEAYYGRGKEKEGE